MSAPLILLAHSWKTDQDPTGWWMSEKLDGVRAYWTGSKFLSRLGNTYDAPEWFTRTLPPTPLDGELWGGRGKFQQTVSIVRTQGDRKSADWKQIAFVVFDAPGQPGGFEDRMAYADSIRDATQNTTWTTLPQDKCTGFDHLKRELARVEQLGGEGLMLRQPMSLYEPKRSHTLLKVKTFHDDEAVVIGYEPGLGRNKDRCGALRVELPNGIQFKVGTGLSDAERENPPAIGTAITFRYQELSNDNVPRFPSYVRVRVE